MLDDKLKQTNQLSTGAMNQAKENLAKLSANENVLELLESSLNEINKKCIDMEMSKVDKEKFEIYKSEVSSRIVMVEFNTKTKMNHLIATDH